MVFDVVFHLAPSDRSQPVACADLARQLDVGPGRSPMVYAGQKVRCQVTPFAWLNTGKKGVSFGLNNVQIVKADAPRIDGRVAANKPFDAIVEEEDEEIPF